MRQIGLAVVLTVSLALAPFAAKAQQTGKIVRVGVVFSGAPTANPLGLTVSQTLLLWASLVIG